MQTILDPKIFDAEIPGYRDIRRARARRIPKSGKTFVEVLFAYRGALQLSFIGVCGPRSTQLTSCQPSLQRHGSSCRCVALLRLSELHRSAETDGARTEGGGVDQCVLSVIVPA